MSLSRREWLRTVGAAGALAPLQMLATPTPSAGKRLSPPVLDVETRYAPGDIVELYSTSDVFTPAHGRTWMKFSFDFPEPAVVFGAAESACFVSNLQATTCLNALTNASISPTPSNPIRSYSVNTGSSSVRPSRRTRAGRTYSSSRSSTDQVTT